MGKRRFHAKRSSQSIPKGLPQKRANDAMTINPFENASFAKKKAKFEVHNRNNNQRLQQQQQRSALQRSLEARTNGLKEILKQQKKAGSFVDRRIGETTKNMSQDERMLARVVRERVRRTKKSSKFTLNDNDDDNAAVGDNGITLTHKGKLIDENYDSKHDSYDDVILSDEDDDRYGGQLDKMDTEMHFGGGAFDRAKSVQANPYGPSDGTGAQSMSMGDAYRSRKNDLDEMIKRRKMEKAEKAKRKEEQMDAFEDMDEHFHQLKSLLQFRDKEKERQEKYDAKKAGTLSDEEKEMDDWNKEVKEYHLERKVKATDRTKTPEEIAKEEADRLHELETRRIARMNGDFEDDDLSDISDDEGKSKYAKKKDKGNKKSKKLQNPDELDSDDSEDDEGKDKLEPRFTPDGLVYVDKDGKIVKKYGEEENDSDDSSDDSTTQESAPSDDNDDSDASESDDESELGSLGGTDDEASAVEDSDYESEDDIRKSSSTLSVGTKVMANYHAEEQFDGMESWHPGTISKVSTDDFGNTVYFIDYDDGDVEENVKRKHIRVEGEKKKVKKEDLEKKKKAMKMKLKRQKAKEKARKDIPYVFEVPTTLEALHEMIGNYAETGKDACLIIERIHASNSVRLDKRNQEKMQNFYDVLLRRFVGVGDALHNSGDGGSELSRYDQLNSLTMTLYHMSQDSPNCAGAVWGRRLGIFQKAHAKRLRDSEFITMSEDEPFTAWHSTGTLLLLRAMGHIFPVTDLRHSVVTPSIILLGQSIAQTPVGSLDDLCRGLLCCSLMIEYCKEATRLPTEALSFLAGTMRLFSDDLEISAKGNPLPSLQVAIKLKEIKMLRENLIKYVKKQDSGKELQLPNMSLERGVQKPCTMSATIFGTVLRLMDAFVVSYSKMSFESEVFEQMVLSILCFNSNTQKSSLPRALTKLVAKTGDLISSQTQFGKSRPPLTRRKSARSAELSIQSFAPRMEDPEKYVMSRDKGKTQIQAERDRIRREYRREHKAAARELRLDAAYIENERRKERKAIDDKARAKRNKNYSWLEQEQATINQQVRKGGGLLKGGGTGLARNTAASGKLGIKRGGKF